MGKVTENNCLIEMLSFRDRKTFRYKLMKRCTLMMKNIKCHEMFRFSFDILQFILFKDSLYGKLSFFTHFSKFVVFIRVM